MRLPGPVRATAVGNVKDATGRTFLWIEKSHKEVGPYVAQCINFAESVVNLLADVYGAYGADWEGEDSLKVRDLLTSWDRATRGE